MELPDNSAYRIRLVLEKTAAIEKGQWVEIDQEIMAVYDNADQDPSLFGTVDAAKAGRMFFQGVIEEREKRAARSGKGASGDQAHIPGEAKSG